MKASLEDVSDELAFWRPAPERHNIAEITLHYAYSVRYVRGQLSGVQPEPFVMEGDDWFSLSGDTLSWLAIRETLESEQQRLVSAVADVIAGRTITSSTDERRFELVLGVTSHAIYHAGQIQLIKKLAGSNR